MTTNIVPEKADRKEAFEAVVKDRFGLLPNFFQTATEAPGLINELWGFAKSAYLDNPLPSLFKERLFVHLSRFCEVRYCIVRHVGFLVGNGKPAGDASVVPQTVDEVVELLRRPGVPSPDDLEASLSRLEASDGPLAIPTANTPDELDVFTAAAVMFLEPRRSDRAREALRAALGSATLELLTAYLAFIRTAHYWTVTHPNLEIEEDMKDLMRRHEELASLLLDTSDGARAEVGQRVYDELVLLRREQDDRVALRKALAGNEEAQRHQKLLIAELNHRVKNTLAIIQSIAAQTLRNQDTPPEIREAFMARLMALADAHDILTAESWVGASLKAVLEKALDAHEGLGGVNRFSLSGPDFRLTPKTAVSLSMAFHELATNAAKYGALSGPTGRVDVEWSIQNNGGDERLIMRWVESGGPPVSAPSRKGFGSRLIERGLAGELAGEAKIDYRPAGLVCNISAPLPIGEEALP